MTDWAADLGLDPAVQAYAEAAEARERCLAAALAAGAADDLAGMFEVARRLAAHVQEAEEPTRSWRLRMIADIADALPGEDLLAAVVACEAFVAGTSETAQPEPAPVEAEQAEPLPSLIPPTTRVIIETRDGLGGDWQTTSCQEVQAQAAEQLSLWIVAFDRCIEDGTMSPEAFRAHACDLLGINVKALDDLDPETRATFLQQLHNGEAGAVPGTLN